MSGIAESNRQQVLTGIATMVDSMHMLKGEVAAGQTRRCRTGRHRTHPSHRLRRGTGAGYLRRQADGTDLTKSGSQLEVPQVFVRMKIRLVLTMVSCRWKLPNLDHYLAEEDLADESQRVSAEGKSQRQIKREEMMIAGEASDLSFCVHVALAQAYGKEVTSLYLKRTRSSTSRASGPVDKGNIRLSNIITNDAAILMNYRVEGSARWLARAWRGHVMNRVLMMMLKAVGANPEVLEYVKNRFSTAISRDQVWS
eukprot:s3645_g9.t1